MKPISDLITNRINRHGRGWVFSARDFLDLGSRDAVDQALSRLAKAGRIRRLARGLYDFPKASKIVGIVPPSSGSVAAALSRKVKNGLQPPPALAANSLGLSNQVPARPVFLTSGMSRTIKAGGVTIALKKTTPRKMTAAGDAAGTVLQALYAVKDISPDQAASRLGSAIPPPKLARIRKKLDSAAPKWMVRVIDKAKGAKRG